MIARYNPDVAPSPSEWLALDEQTRLDLVRLYHADHSGAAPRYEKAHYVIHVILETQLAEGIQAIVDAFVRMQHEGLSRHDAIHAVGSILLRHLREMLKPGKDGKAAWLEYVMDVERLHASQWLNGEEDP